MAQPIAPQMSGLRRPIRSTCNVSTVHGTRTHELTDKSDKDKHPDHAQSSRDAVYHERLLSRKAQCREDSRSVIVVDVDAGPLAHSLDQTAANGSMQVGFGVDEISVRARHVFAF